MSSFLVDLNPILSGPGESEPVVGDLELEPFEVGGESVTPRGPMHLDLVVENV